MRVVILTTDTPHHAFFAREVASRFAETRVLCETKTLHPPFETAHPFEWLRDQYERRAWFAEERVGVADFAPTESVSDLNDPAATSLLSRLAPDAIIVFGTGRLKPPVLTVQPRLTLNLHGGDPEEYRGLDSHLWAIYHRDFSALVTTLHRVTPDLDSGDIVSQAPVPLRRSMSLYELRRANTEICLELTLAALNTIMADGDVPSRPQRRKGRYYSFMPAPLKEICRAAFESYTARIEQGGAAR